MCLLVAVCHFKGEKSQFEYCDIEYLSLILGSFLEADDLVQFN